MTAVANPYYWKSKNDEGEFGISDEQWEYLFGVDRVTQNQKKAEEKVKEFTTDEWKYLRKRAKNDLFFLGHGVLGYNAFTVRLHGHLCQWMHQMWEELYTLILMPRGHFKSTTETISDTIQIVLPDEAQTCPFPRNLGPDARILIGHETAEGASRFNYEITGHFTSNVTLMGLFPECVPNPRVQRMNKRELELPRSIIRAEPTIDTMGVGGKAQGRHYDVIKLDDIFGDKARDSSVERNTCIQWFDNIQAFLVSLVQGQIRLVGTRYSLDDVYGHAMEVYEDELKRYVRRIREINPETEKLEPILPERFPERRLRILQKNPKVWSAQYVNDPVAGLARFDRSWKRFYERVGENRVAIFTGDNSHIHNVRDLDIVILADPAVSKLPGIVVTGTSPSLNVFILEAIKEPMSPTKFVDLIFRLVQRWWPRLVGIESVVFSAVYESWIRREMGLRGTPFNIEAMRPPTEKTKRERVMGLEPYFSAGQIYFHEDQKELIQEFNEFGATDNYHLLDALAYGPERWRPGLDRKTWESYKKAEEDILDQRDPLTGYSRMY